MNSTLDLRAVEPFLRSQAAEAFEQGDAALFVYSCSGGAGLALVADNFPLLQQKGIYEACLFHAYTGTRSNFRAWPSKVIGFLFSIADQAKLRQAGDPIPRQSIFRVFRGVAGHGAARRLRGFSWTLSVDAACWFATTYQLNAPSVLSAEITNQDVLAFHGDCVEQEVICQPKNFRHTLLTLEEMKDRAARHLEERKKREKARLTTALTRISVKSE